jgi:reactive chlorine resistance protein C
MKVISPGSATAHRSSPRPAAVAATEHPVAVAGRLLVRYGLVVVVAWIGALKYSTYEATAIQPLIAHSPLMSWLYHIFGVGTLAAVLGSVEIVAALLIAVRPWWPRVSAVGSALGVLLFLGTLSFLFSTPGVAAPSGFPVLSVMPGQFLLKDLVLLGAALWTLGDSLGAARARAASSGDMT